MRSYRSICRVAVDCAGVRVVREYNETPERPFDYDAGDAHRTVGDRIDGGDESMKSIAVEREN